MNSGVEAYLERAAQGRLDQLVLNHLDLVRHIVARLTGQLPQGVDRENLHAAGVLGLVEAARNFDDQRGVAFAAFARTRIRGAILDELRRNCPLPQAMLQRIAQVHRACERVPPPPTPEAIALQTGLSVEEIEECLEAERLTRTASWNTNDARHPTDDSADQPLTAMERAEQCELLADRIEELPPDERTILTLYYLEDLRLKEIGVVVGLSESRVSRLLARAELRLRDQLRDAEAY